MSLIERVEQHIVNSDKRNQVYPPASLAEVLAIENRLGFEFPCLLRGLLTQVGNGGFGPGYGILGVSNSVTGGAYDNVGFDKLYLGDLYLLSRQAEEEQYEGMLVWPEQLLPFCHWGCGIYSCLDCSKPGAPVIVHDPNLLMDDGKETWENCFLSYRLSFASWLEAWLDDVDLWTEIYGTE